MVEHDAIQAHHDARPEYELQGNPFYTEATDKTVRQLADCVDPTIGERALVVPAYANAAPKGSSVFQSRVLEGLTPGLRDGEIALCPTYYVVPDQFNGYAYTHQGLTEISVYEALEYLPVDTGYWPDAAQNGFNIAVTTTPAAETGDMSPAIQRPDTVTLQILRAPADTLQDPIDSHSGLPHVVHYLTGLQTLSVLGEVTVTYPTDATSQARGQDTTDIET